jgi:NitT/TauT family transport system permease protein
MSVSSIAGRARKFAGRQGKAWFFNVCSVLLLLLLWQLIIVCTDVSSALFPSPFQTWRAFLEILNNGTLFDHFISSMYRFAVGFFVSVSVAVVFGLVFGWIDWLFRLVNPVLQILRPISPIAWMPFIVLAFGIGDAPAVVIIFLAGFFPVFLSTVAGVRNIPDIYFRVSASFGVGPVEIFWKVIFPAAFPQITSGIHLALGTAWVFLVCGEMVGAQSGLGYLIIDARNNLRYDILMTDIIVIGIIGFIMDSALGKFEKFILKKWGISE